MRDALWYGDGTKLNLYYRNEQGKMCTTGVYEVMDAYSETLLGYDIAPNENFDCRIVPTAWPWKFPAAVPTR